MTGFRLAVRATQLIAALGLFAAAAPVMADERFVISADGQEVQDKTSNLTWARCADGLKWDGKACAGKLAKYDFAGAKKQAADVAKATSKAWRVPTKDELLALVDKKATKKPLIDAVAFPDTPKNQFWATRPGFDDNLNAWLVNFSNGKVYGNAGERKFNLRLVRAS